MRARDVKPFLHKTLERAEFELELAQKELRDHVTVYQRNVDVAQAKVEATKALIADMEKAGAAGDGTE